MDLQDCTLSSKEISKLRSRITRRVDDWLKGLSVHSREITLFKDVPQFRREIEAQALYFDIADYISKQLTTITTIPEEITKPYLDAYGDIPEDIHKRLILDYYEDKFVFVAKTEIIPLLKEVSRKRLYNLRSCKIDYDLSLKILESILADIPNALSDQCKKYNPLWCGTGISISQTQENLNKNSDINISSQYAQEISCILYLIRDNTKPWINYLNKDYFYSAIANNIQKELLCEPEDLYTALQSGIEMAIECINDYYESAVSRFKGEYNSINRYLNVVEELTLDNKLTTG